MSLRIGIGTNLRIQGFDWASYWNTNYLGTRRAFGDSITHGYISNVDDPTNAFVNLVANETGWTIVNQGIISTEMADNVGGQIYLNPTLIGETYLLLSGYNDARHMGAAGKKTFIDALRCALCWLAIPNSAKRYGQDGSITLWPAADWHHLILYPTGTGIILDEYCSVNDYTATFVANGTTIYIAYTARPIAGIGATFTVTIDGVLKATVDTSAVVPVSAIPFWPSLVRISGLTTGDHTVIIKNIINGKFLNLDWIASNGSLPAYSPQVFSGNTLKMNVAGYAIGGPTYNNASDVIIDDYNLDHLALINELAGDGLKVNYVDACSEYAKDVGADNIHPSLAGHIKIKNAFFDKIKNHVT
ncbi:MAG: hypothetical protein MUO72_09385 [Bacteroidales bacterium]|nr:hypothetical protein [Bacteroidales bacterium]